MTVNQRVSRLLKEHGIKAYLDGADCDVYCIIQPMRYKNKMYVDSQYTKLGIVDESCFLYIGPPECDLIELIGVQLHDEFDRHFSCVKTEKVFLGKTPLYTWGILRLGG